MISSLQRPELVVAEMFLERRDQIHAKTYSALIFSCTASLDLLPASLSYQAFVGREIE